MRVSTPWIAYHNPKPQARLRLFCFPYAGGGAGIFRDWGLSLPDTVEIVPIQLPGRESRSGEKPYHSLKDLVSAVTEALVPYLDAPFALFGHSMGAVIAFEATRALVSSGHRSPEHLAVSGRRGPSLPVSETMTHTLPDDEFVQQLIKFHGTPVEILQCPEVLNFYLPVLRADFRLCETYAYSPGPPLKLPISVYGGVEDLDVPRQDLQAWSRETSHPCRVRLFPGGHFFLKQHRKTLLATLQEDLSEYLG